MSATIAETAALELSGLSAGYGRFDVVRDLALRVAPGEAVGLVGPNGAGKTTVLRAIMGMIKHRRGTVRVGGTDVSSLRAHQIARGHAALVPEGRRLFSELSVEDNLRLGALHLRRDHARVEALLASVYELFPALERYRERPSTALSGGEQQMVAIGRMLMSDPELLLLDEPSLGLAPAVVDAVYGALARIRERVPLLLVEQDTTRALNLCDRAYVLRGGRLAMTGTAAELRDAPDLVAAYLT